MRIGSLDDPEAARPTEQFGIESELSWTADLKALAAKRTEDWMRENGVAQIDVINIPPSGTAGARAGF